MPYRVLLDTNIISHMMRFPDGQARQRLQSHGEENVCTSIFCASELWYGAFKKKSDRLMQEVENILGRLPVLPFESPADVHLGRLRALLFSAGTPIGPTDLLIAAHALSLALPIATANVRDFRKVPGLVVENWLD